MRDPTRIDRILDSLRDIWKKNPDLRLGQLICNVVSESIIYFVEDEAMIEAVEKYYKNFEEERNKDVDI